MKSNSLEAQIERAERSTQICRFNIANQIRKLEEIYIRITAVQNILREGNHNSSPPSDRENLIKIKNNLDLYVNRQIGLIDELEKELIKAEDNLRNIQFNYSLKKV